MKKTQPGRRAGLQFLSVWAMLVLVSVVSVPLTAMGNPEGGPPGAPADGAPKGGTGAGAGTVPKGVEAKEVHVSGTLELGKKVPMLKTADKEYILDIPELYIKDAILKQGDRLEMSGSSFKAPVGAPGAGSDVLIVNSFTVGGKHYTVKRG